MLNLRVLRLVGRMLLCLGVCVLFTMGCQGNRSNVFAEKLEGPCQGLFGKPSDNTGLSSEQCKPSCTCGDVTWTPPNYDKSWSDPLLQWKLSNPPALLTSDPYAKPAPKSPDGTVCAMLPDADQSLTYSLKTYPSVQTAEAAGARVTHFGPCGLCSSLQNLHVYMTQTDLTGPVRSCALKGLGGSEEKVLTCLMDIGFDKPCAQIWYYNTTHTRKQCLEKCLLLLDSPHHTKDGKLNECIQCDEDKSGPVFKAISGRTRRNSGLPSALCRPSETVRPITHDYGNRAVDEP